MSVKRKPETPSQPDVEGSHLTDLADGWKTWRTFCLRGAGFPIAGLARLAAPEAAAAVGAYLERSAASEQAHDRVMERLDALSRAADGETLRALRRARRRLSRGRSPESDPGIAELDPLIVEMAAAKERANAARVSAETAVAEALVRVSDYLREVGRDSRFREAVTWQNRRVLSESIDVLLRMPAASRNRVARRHEQLVANYLQRYCAKNETIGFFGPLAWGTWVDRGPSLAQRPEAEFLTARSIHLEYWSLAALAEALSALPDLRPWLAPRLDASRRIEGHVLIDAQGGQRQILPHAIQALMVCDGVTAARDIAARLVADPECSLNSDQDVFAVLNRAVEHGLVNWSLNVPVGPDPEASLREILVRIGDPELRSRLLQPLEELVAARDAVAAAAGQAEALDAAFGRLESVFTRITGRSAYQHQGQVYAGRTLVYEDCRRGTTLEVGPDVRERIAPPLALILQSARWFSHAIATRFESRLRQVFSALEARFAPESVPVGALDFVFERGDPSLPGIVRQVADELAGKWAEILAVESSDREVLLLADDLRDRVASAFDAPGPGWPGARHHSADILIGVGKDQQGKPSRYLCVLGEVHVTDTMLMRQVIRALHPHPAELVEAYRRDIDQAQIYRVTTPGFVGHRKVWEPFLSDDFLLARDGSPTWRSGDGVLRLADLVIEDSPAGLVVRSRDRRYSFPALVYFERLLWRESFTEFKLLPPMPHTPRIIIDSLVVRRESWRFICRELGFAFEKTETERFIAARRWARQFDLPRWVFIRVPQEYKPVYVDLVSPVSVEILAKLVRRAVEIIGVDSVVGVSEMLPNPKNAWLADAESDTYASELRIVAVDPVAWQPSPAAA